MLGGAFEATRFRIRVQGPGCKGLEKQIFTVALWDQGLGSRNTREFLEGSPVDIEKLPSEAPTP